MLKIGKPEYILFGPKRKLHHTNISSILKMNYINIVIIYKKYEPSKNNYQKHNSQNGRLYTFKGVRFVFKLKIPVLKYGKQCFTNL